MSLVPPGSLISLASVREWLNTGDSSKPFPPFSDGMLGRMVGAASVFVASYLSRPIAPATYSEVYDGTGRSSLPLRQRPVLLVRSLTIGTTSVSARPSVGAFGFLTDGTGLLLDGCGTFCRGVQNVAVTYDAGFQQADAVTVPSTLTLSTAADLTRTWNTDRGIAYATGAAFTRVTTAPALAGTYQFTPDGQGSGQYAFAAGDLGAAIVVTYGYTPDDIAQALIEWVGERYKTRDRIGETSQSMRGIVQVSFSSKDMNEAIRTVLGQYKNVTPVQ